MRFAYDRVRHVTRTWKLFSPEPGRERELTAGAPASSCLHHHRIGRRGSVPGGDGRWYGRGTGLPARDGHRLTYDSPPWTYFGVGDHTICSEMGIPGVPFCRQPAVHPICSAGRAARPVFLFDLF